MKVDFHTHAFADAIAAKAIATLEAELPAGVKAHFDGRVGTLAAELVRNGIDAAVLCSIATKPSQFEPIMKWSSELRAGAHGAEAARRIVPFLSVHPADPDAHRRIAQTAAAGFAGLKLHPYYQKFVLDAPETLDYLRCARDHNLIVISHTGFDIAYPRERIADPVRIARVVEALPDLKFVATHLGAWEDWGEVERHLIGRPIYIEMSYAFDYLDDARMRAMLMRHPADRLLFGTDWPWSRHADVLPRLEALKLDAPRQAALMGDNAARLLGLQP
ncbi:MAG: amidohydrolase family protein [Kiritimatiellae bacterium]|nr:amidohydrolase family protein [Kiritimatiellia bacterium]